MFEPDQGNTAVNESCITIFVLKRSFMAAREGKFVC